jgi:hypothetical protein
MPSIRTIRTIDDRLTLIGGISSRLFRWRNLMPRIRQA